MKKYPARDSGMKNKWPGALLDDGFVPVARRFVRNYWRLEPKISADEFVFIVNLVDYAWTDSKAFPSWQKISFDLGITVEDVVRTLMSLQSKGYLEFVSIGEEDSSRGQGYKLTGLYQALQRESGPPSFESMQVETRPHQESDQLDVDL